MFLISFRVQTNNAPSNSHELKKNRVEFACSRFMWKVVSQSRNIVSLTGEITAYIKHVLYRDVFWENSLKYCDNVPLVGNVTFPVGLKCEKMEIDSLDRVGG